MLCTRRLSSGTTPWSVMTARFSESLAIAATAAHVLARTCGKHQHGDIQSVIKWIARLFERGYSQGQRPGALRITHIHTHARTHAHTERERERERTIVVRHNCAGSGQSTWQPVAAAGGNKICILLKNSHKNMTNTNGTTIKI